MKALIISVIVVLVLPASMRAQVDEIKKESSNHSRKSSGSGDGSTSSSSSGGSFWFGVFLDATFGSWQRYKMDRREVNREMTSLEIIAQGGVNPLNNSYLIHPRIRGSWGLFATDFRFNFLLESDVEGVKHLRTDDWQILQLNLVTARHAIFRVGGGLLHEAFGNDEVYGEWTAALQINSTNHRFGGTVEYRGSEPRRELSGHLRYRVFESGIMHGFITGGVVYQNYYETIDVMGLQGGFIFKLY